MADENNSILVGITGGIGSGKSAVASILREHGLTVLDADIIASEITEQDGAVRTEFRRLFGDGIFRSDNTLDRAAVARLVFGETPEHSSRLRAMNRITHPRVLDRLRAEIEAVAASGAKVITVDIALLFETGLADAFDYVVLVTATEAARIQRVMQRAGLTEEQIRFRMKSQDTDEHKKSFADFVIENNGSIDNLRKAAEFLAETLPLLPPKPHDDESDGEES
ncbi:MAG: dephospho-CoA kinase [Bacteroidetes bacterium]|jgi:dephospho-CoA kinase|nr:dephospho-CoA kinase [Bacteroidota bacterium]MCZ2102422.1 dephospho-CoA kinase [Chitinophagales bacterium]